MGTYEKHKVECMTKCDNWIKQVVDDKQEISLHKVELVFGPKYQCDIIKILHKRYELHKLAYPDLLLDKKENCIRLKTDLEKKNDEGKVELSLNDSVMR